MAPPQVIFRASWASAHRLNLEIQNVEGATHWWYWLTVPEFAERVDASLVDAYLLTTERFPEIMATPPGDEPPPE
jgi:hypothetical protein